MLVGHSLGGMFMRVYAHNYPVDVVGMVLVDSTHEERLVRYPELIKLNMDAARQFRLLALLNSTGLLALAPQSIPNRGFPNDALGQYRATLATTKYFETVLAEINAMEKRSAEVRDLQITTLENLPLIVLSAGLPDAIPAFSDAENQQYWQELMAEQSELTALSSEAKQVVANQSGHHIQLDQPVLVIDAIREVVNMVRK